MKDRIFLVFMLAAGVFSFKAHSYKVEVHAIMTDTAAKRSVLSSSSLWNQFGINFVSGAPPLLPVERFIPESKLNWEKLQSDKEGIINPDLEFDYAKLMAFGADIEDTGVEFMDGDNRNLIVGLSRAYNHFYNPQNNTKLELPLNIFGLTDFNYASPDWMLERTTHNHTLIGNQNYSYRDAQAYFYDMFTGGGASTSPMNHRIKYFSRTLQTLGHVVHHIQDMGQPQHTRLDPHCDHYTCQWDNFVGPDHDDTSIYEVYTKEAIRCGESDDWVYGATGIYHKDAPETVNCNIADDSFGDFKVGPIFNWGTNWRASKIDLYSYPVVNALGLVDGTPDARDFWTNSKGSGIGDFSSKNFVSTDTAFQLTPCETDDCSILERLSSFDDTLPLPSGKESDAVYTIVPHKLKDLLKENGVNSFAHIPIAYKNATIKFLSRTFTDKYTGQEVVNPRLASLSMFNERLTRMDKEIYRSGRTPPVKNPPMFTTNYFNMDAHAGLLIPRAVGYSAGMINYFFRYSLNAELISFEQDIYSTARRLTAIIRIHNSSDYDLESPYAATFSERVTTGGMRKWEKISSNRKVIPKDSYADFTVYFNDSYEYTGGLSMVFYSLATNTIDGEKISADKLAETGLYFNINLPEIEQPTVCDGEYYATTDFGFLSKTITLGTNPGTVKIALKSESFCSGPQPFLPELGEYDCPTVSLKVLAVGSNQLIKELGENTNDVFAPGYYNGSASFYFDPSVLGTDSVKVRFVSSGGDYSASSIYVGCPNGGSGTIGRQHQVSFAFSSADPFRKFRPVVQVHGYGTFDLGVNGGSVQVALPSGIHNLDLKLGVYDSTFGAPDPAFNLSAGAAGKWPDVANSTQEAEAIFVGFDGVAKFVGKLKE